MALMSNEESEEERPCEMARSLKNCFLYATVAFLAACQAPQASDQQNPPARIGQSNSASSQYEVDSINPVQRAGFHGGYRGSSKGP
jgi:hypothetical protein